MTHARLIYLAVLAGCGIFCIAYGQWFSRVLLTVTMVFPWLSLLLSLRAIRNFHAAPAGPESLLTDSYVHLWLVGSSSLPMPPFRGTLKLRSGFTGETLRYNDDKGIPTAHCGSYTVTVMRGRVYDYLGLFSFPIQHSEEKTLRILPKPLPVSDFPPLSQQSFPHQHTYSDADVENHQLRLYHPGDSLNRIHWKLSAKTGQLLIREPIPAQSHTALLTLTLQGTRDALDRKLGRLVWLGNYLLRQDFPFVLKALTGCGLLEFSIQMPYDLQRALDALLVCPLTQEECLPLEQRQAFWHYHIGGKPDDPA